MKIAVERCVDRVRRQSEKECVADLAERVGKTDVVIHEAAVRDRLAFEEDRGNPVTGR